MSDMADCIEKESIPFTTILYHLKNRSGSVEEDLAFARLIVANHERAVNYFLGDYSVPILNYVATNILRLKSNSEYGKPYEGILSDYYLFIAAPFHGGECGKAEWYKITLYKGDARLYTYVSTITIRYFIKHKAKVAKKEKNVLELLEFVDYESLLKYDKGEGGIDEDELSESLRVLHEAFLSLKERDQIVLRYLVMDNMHWAEAFEALRIYLNPKGPDDQWENWSFEEKQKAIDEHWNAKQKQDAMAGLKKRAIAHIASKFNKLKEQNNGDTF